MNKESLSSEKQIELYKKYKDLITKYCNNHNSYDKIMHLIESEEERLIMSPASSFAKFHGCYIGGLIEHLVDTIYSGLYIRKFYEKMNTSNLPSEESVVFCAALHDIGKLGTEKDDYYIIETSEWHRDKLGRLYNINEKIINLHHADLSLYLLNHYSINLTADEYQAIRVHDGPAGPGNEKYGINVGFLTHIIQQADFMSTVLRKNKE